MPLGYGIFSGGLDSMLAALLLKDQDVEVRLLTFVTPFFGADRAQASGRAIGIRPRPVDLTARHLEMMQKPKHGFGRFMNPCIDCHALMFRRAGEIMEEEGGDFLFSGEVLGQRPKSQNRKALDIVAAESGYAGRILRPLSARCLPPTPMEQQGLVDREALMDFSGRNRKPQMALAEKYRLNDYPTPAGGCLLTDPVFSRRLRELREQSPERGVLDIELLKHGRHFRLPGGGKAVVGRNQADNEALEALAGNDLAVLKAIAAPGPTAIYRPSPEGAAGDLQTAADLVASYAGGGREEYRIRFAGSGGEDLLAGTRRPKDEFAGMMI